MQNALIKLARPFELLLGLVFLAAAVLKAMDANLFVAQIFSYQVVKAPELLRLVALSTLGVEAFLGVAMILGLRLRMLVLTLVQAMLVVFTGLIIYAWVVHGIKDCGCFGRVKFTPPQAISKNVVMMIVAAIAWRGIHLKGEVQQGGGDMAYRCLPCRGHNVDGLGRASALEAERPSAACHAPCAVLWPCGPRRPNAWRGGSPCGPGAC